MCADAEDQTATDPFDLRLGPLCYRFFAGDDWGRCHLRAMTAHLCAGNPIAAPDRIVRIAREPVTEPGSDWRFERTPLGTVSHSPTAPTATWTAATSGELPDFTYQLPWSLIVADMTPRNGAIIHAGLGVRNDRGVLFLAPSGGGKSTTLASAPPGWTVLSDDAALIWPADGQWQASPLPSWTMMTSSAKVDSAESRFDPGICCNLCGLIVIAKEPVVSLVRLRPIDAASWIFRALNEYPSTVLLDPPLKEFFFHTACAMARTLPCWRLGLPLGGDIWPRLDALFAEPT